MLILVENVFGVFVEVVGEKGRQVRNVAKETGVPGVDEDFINLVRRSGDCVRFMVIVGKSPGVGDLVNGF